MQRRAVDPSIRKTTAKMGGLCEETQERSKNSSGGKKWREKANNMEQRKKMTKVAVQWSDNCPASPLQTGNERKNKDCCQCMGLGQRRRDRGS